MSNLGVRVVALANSRHCGGKVKPGTLAGFAGRIEWRQLAAEYGGDHLLSRTDSMYGMKR